MIIPVSVTSLFVLAVGDSIWNHSANPAVQMGAIALCVWAAWFEGGAWAEKR